MGQLQNRLSERFRGKRDIALRNLILTQRKDMAGPFRILDVGGRADYWARVGFDFLDAHDLEILCLNYSQAELHAEKDQHPRLQTAVGDARKLDMPDNSFHLVHSNSVIEHVGNFSDKRAFANEVRRLAPSYYVQTPNFWFPIDPHWPRFPFFHWLPLSWRHRLLCRFSLGWGGRCRDIDHAMGDLEATVLLDGAMMATLFPESRIRYEWFAFLPKSMIAERRRDQRMDTGPSAP